MVKLIRRNMLLVLLMVLWGWWRVTMRTMRLLGVHHSIHIIAHVSTLPSTIPIIHHTFRVNDTIIRQHGQFFQRHQWVILTMASTEAKLVMPLRRALTVWLLMMLRRHCIIVVAW